MLLFYRRLLYVSLSVGLSAQNSEKPVKQLSRNWCDLLEICVVGNRRAIRFRCHSTLTFDLEIYLSISRAPDTP